jgi:hypothetical protein
LTRESPYCARLQWQGEPGISYGVESRPNAASGAWGRMSFITGGNTVVASNTLVEAGCIVSPSDTARFFRVLETN